MRRKMLMFFVVVLAVAFVGCQTCGRGLHTVPASRDYQQLQKASVKEAKPLVAKAHRVGGMHYAPYDYFSAKDYLKAAKEERSEGDRPGEKDFASLSKGMAEAAIAKGGIADKGETPMPKNLQASQAEFDRLKGRWAELNKEKAIQVSPVIYAHVTAALSLAEHELIEKRDYPCAARTMGCVDSDIDTIWSQDVDKDGIVDMKDGAPWAPEDKDGFEDTDGVPDPDNDKDGILDPDDKKPMDPETKNRWHDEDGAPDAYPTLEMVHFGSGSAVISTDMQGYLRGITQLVVEWPEIKLHLAGHTDSSSTEKYNLGLSQRRAENVRDYLVKHGCPANQLVVTFHGESQPIADNKTGKGMAMNRRVEVKFE